MSTTLVELAPVSMDMTDFEASFKEAIPCNHCPTPAEWRSFGHRVNDCGVGRRGEAPPFYLCNVCYASWKRWADNALQDEGLIECNNCKQTFETAEDFSDYRKF